MAQPRRINLDEQGKLGSLTTDIIADLAITEAKLANDIVSSSKLKDGSVTDVKISPTANITLSKLAPVTPNLVLISNGSGVLSASTITTTELSHLAGLTVNLQATLTDLQVQLDGKLSASSGITGLIGDVITSGSGVVPSAIQPGVVTPNKLNINTDLSFQNHQALRLRLENLSSDPLPGNPGRVIWRTDLGQIRVDNGSSFVPVTSSGTGVSFAKYRFTIANSSQTAHVMPHTMKNSSEVVALNGIVLDADGSADYQVIGGTTIQLWVVVFPGDKLVVTYAY